MRIEKLDHLLSKLRQRVFTPIDLDLSLSFRRGTPELRSDIVGEDPAGWQTVDPDLVWGEPEAYFWFATTVVLPDHIADQRIFLGIDAQFGSTHGRSDPQCLVRINGAIAQGADGNHREVQLTAKGNAGDRFEVLIEAGTIEDRRQHGMKLSVMVHDPLVEKLFYDLSVPLNVARLLPSDDPRRHFILNHVNDALKQIDYRPGNATRFAASLHRAEAIGEAIYAAADFEEKPVITVTGHTHIDVAWLWRIRETRQKMARSMATALALMDEYPDYQFMYNQGVLLDWLSQDYPELFDRVQSQVKAGRFEIEGALWLEPDANITSGESFVRHILHGVRYHEETFSVTPRIFWLPDTFGYSAALPQLMKLSGVDVFVTHKLSWNDTNRMPNETFHWEGIDGSTVAAYFLTTQPYTSKSIGTTYCPDLKPTHVMGTWRRHGQQDLNTELFLVYGHGDGGGGPTREMLENIRRMEKGIPGCPAIRHEPMRPFFDRLLQRMADRPADFPTWVGELYLEFHRGTLTSVAKNKRNNRYAEQVLRELEALAVIAELQVGHAYPGEELHALWRIVLLNQFHDILPGSSVEGVFVDSDRDYADFFARADALRASLVGNLLPSGTMGVFNPLGRPRDGLLQLAVVEPHAVTLGGKRLETQTLHHADGSQAQAVPVAALAPMALTSMDIAPAGAASGTSDLQVTEGSLENDRLSLRFNPKGQIVSIIDKQLGRELLRDGHPANRLQAYRDMPVQYDAWDIDDSFEDQVWEIDDLISAQVVETGPYRTAIRFEWRYESSRIVQVIALEAGSPRVDIDSFVDWHEHDTLIKAAFPLEIHARESTAEIQFGHVRRPTHRNTSWDEARFETVMHRWMDLSEPDFGVAFFNDSKYGYDVRGSTVRLTLLKSPTYPWPNADQGEHRFRYALRVHHGLHDTDIPAEAEAYNLPLRLVAGARDLATATSAHALVSIAGDGVTLEAVKKAENGDAVILRLWETRGRGAEVIVTMPPGARTVERVNLLEREPETLSLSEGKVCLTFTPFEIVTLRVTIAEK